MRKGGRDEGPAGKERKYVREREFVSTLARGYS
jgi:hypothetical protein